MTTSKPYIWVMARGIDLKNKQRLISAASDNIVNIRKKQKNKKSKNQKKIFYNISSDKMAIFYTRIRGHGYERKKTQSRQYSSLNVV